MFQFWVALPSCPLSTLSEIPPKPWTKAPQGNFTARFEKFIKFDRVVNNPSNSSTYVYYEKQRSRHPRRETQTNAVISLRPAVSTTRPSTPLSCECQWTQSGLVDLWDEFSRLSSVVWVAAKRVCGAVRLVEDAVLIAQRKHKKQISCVDIKTIREHVALLPYSSAGKPRRTFWKRLIDYWALCTSHNE